MPGLGGGDRGTQDPGRGLLGMDPDGTAAGTAPEEASPGAVEVGLARGNLRTRQACILRGRADHGDPRIAEHHARRHPAAEDRRHRPAGVVARDAPLVRGLVQQRRTRGGVTGETDPAPGDVQPTAGQVREPLPQERQPALAEPERIEIVPPADRGRGIDPRHLDVQTRDGLADLQPLRAETGHRRAPRQGVELEAIVRGRDAFAEALAQALRDHRTRAGRDHAGAGAKPSRAGAQRGVGLEDRPLGDETRPAPRLQVRHDIGHQPVAQRPRPRQHLGGIDPQMLGPQDARRTEGMPAVDVAGRLHEGPRGHAGHPRAGRASGVGIEDPAAFGDAGDLRPGRKPRLAGPDDGDAERPGRHRRLGFAAGSNSIEPMRRTVLACGPIPLSPVRTTSSTVSFGRNSSKLPSTTALRWK